jgi:hypothetical protein
MGNWNINVQGIGCHHNNIPSDADRMAAQFVRDLRAAGHTVEGATFTSGSKVDIAVSAAPENSQTRSEPLSDVIKADAEDYLRQTASDTDDGSDLPGSA